jgi:hypothetical protein
MSMHRVYDLPNWLFGVLTVLVFSVFGLGGLVLTRKWVPTLHHRDHSYNDVVGFYLGALTVFYGITLGLLMVGVWGNFTDVCMIRTARQEALIARGDTSDLQSEEVCHGSKSDGNDQQLSKSGYRQQG